MDYIKNIRNFAVIEIKYNIKKIGNENDDFTRN